MVPNVLFVQFVPDRDALCHRGQCPLSNIYTDSFLFLENEGKRDGQEPRRREHRRFGSDHPCNCMIVEAMASPGPPPPRGTYRAVASVPALRRAGLEECPAMITNRAFRARPRHDLDRSPWLCVGHSILDEIPQCTAKSSYSAQSFSVISLTAARDRSRLPV